MHSLCGKVEKVLQETAEVRARKQMTSIESKRQEEVPFREYMYLHLFALVLIGSNRRPNGICIFKTPRELGIIRKGNHSAHQIMGTNR